MNQSLKKVFVSGIAAVSMMLGACGNGNAADEAEGNVIPDEEPIRIGTIWELTGHGSAYGLSQANAAQMAVDEINAAGGVLGRDLELVNYDSKTDDAEASILATRLPTNDGVIAIFGPSYTGGFLASIPAGNLYKVPFLNSSVTQEDVTLDENGEVFPYVWRTSTPNSIQAAGLTEFATNTLGAQKGIILADNSTDYGTSWSAEFENRFEGEIVSIENFSTDQTDFSATLTKINGMDFDVMFIPGYYEQLGPIVKQAREMGIDAPILGSNGFGNPIIYELAGAENMTDIYYPTEFFIEGDDIEVVAFREAYNAKFDNESDMFAGIAYDNVFILAEAIERAGVADSVKINEELANTRNFEGITGTISFDEEHNPIKATPVVEIQDGGPVKVHAVETN